VIAASSTGGIISPDDDARPGPGVNSPRVNVENRGRAAASHGYPEFSANCDAVVMGRSAFRPALGAPTWPWAGLQVYVTRVYPFQVLLPARLTGLPRDSKAQAEQVRSVTVERIGHRLGQLPAAFVSQLDQALRIHLGL
jgi:hypothetical protein